MALIICAECGKEFSDKAAACPNCGCPNSITTQQQITIGNTAREISQDKVSKSEVIKHLKYAGDLETTIFTLKTAYTQIEQKIQSLGHKRNISRPAKVYYDFPFWGTFFISFAILLVLSCAILEGSVFDVILILTIIPLIFGSSYLLVDVGIAFGGALAIAIVGGIIHIVRRNSAHNALEKAYKKEVLEDEERVKKEKGKILILRQQQEAILDKIQTNETLLKRLYELNIIFPKYRHMVAVITMLEYFESGRCEQLTGGHGAYDTYSYEEKQNIIIGKLDVVIDMLNDIRNTQYLLYEAIQEANDTANRIYAQSERIIESNGRIAENAALTAYNSDIIRQSTTISAYIDVFSWK